MNLPISRRRDALPFPERALVFGERPYGARDSCFAHGTNVCSTGAVGQADNIGPCSLLA